MRHNDLWVRILVAAIIAAAEETLRQKK